MPAAANGPKRSIRNRPSAPTTRRIAPAFNDPAFVHTFSDTSDALLIVDLKGIIKRVNRAAARLFSSTITALRGAELFSMVAGEQRAAFRKEWRTLRTGVGERKELTMVGAKGRSITVDLVCIPGRKDRHLMLRLHDMTESYASLEAFREAERRYSAFINNSSEGIWCFGVKEPIDITLPVKRQIELMYEHGYLRECNDAYAMMYGFDSASQIVGVMLKDVMPRTDAKNIAYLTDFIRSGYRLRESGSTEQDRNGRTFTVVNNLVGTVVEGMLIDAWGTQRDVTEKHKAEQELRSAKEAYVNLIHRVPFVIYTWRLTADGTRRLEYVSPQCADMLGVQPEELLRDNSLFAQLIHPDDRQLFIEHGMNAERPLRPFKQECRAALVSGERWLLFESTPTVEPNGEIVWNGIVRDVTDRKRAEQELLATKDEYADLIRRIPVVVYKWRRTTTGAYVLDYISPRLKEIFGIDPAEVMNDVSKIIERIHPDDRESFLALNEEHARSLAPFSTECRFVHRGEVRWIQFDSTPARLANGDVLWDGIMQETTERQRAIDQLHQQSEQHRFLADASARLAECDTDTQVFSLISSLLTGLITDSVVFALKTSLDGATSTLMEIGGIDNSIVMMGAKLLRYDPRGRQFKNKTGFVSQFCRPNLHLFEGGLHEASDGVVPKFIARRIERLLGTSHFYSVGISTGESFFGYIHIMTPRPLAIEAATIEAFMHQCYLALTKIEALRRNEEEVSRRRFFFEYASDGIVVLDKERRVVEVNGRFLEMHGYSSEEMLQMHSWDFSADFPTKQAMAKRFPGPPPTDQLLETRHRRKDGSILDVELSFNLALAHAEPQVYCVCRDITERKRAAMLIEQEAVRRKTLMNTSGDGIVIIDQEHRVVECNARFGEMLGYAPAEMLTLQPWDWEAITSEEDIRRDFRDLRLIKRTFDTRHRRKDGSIYEAEVSIGGTEIGGEPMVIAIIRDVTERKRIERSLQKSEERYRTLVNRIPQRVFLKDTDSLYVSCNEAYGSDLGLTPDLIAGKDDYQFFPSHIAEQYRASDRRVIESGQPLEQEEEYILNGVGRVIHTTKVPMVDTAGTVTGVLGIFSDITERKKMERIIADNEERMRAYLEHSPAIITITDRTGHIRYMNRAEGGLSPRDLIGRSIFEIIHPDHHAEVRTALEESLRDHSTRSFLSSSVLNGETWWYENRVVALNGGTADLLITAINVTEQRRAEQERRTIEERIRMSEESYRGLFNSVQDAIYILDGNGVFIDVNTGAETMYGYSHDELVGRSPADVSAPGRNDDLDLPYMLRRAMDGEPQQFEFWGQRKNGDAFPKDVRLYPGTYYGNRVVIALAQDITVRKRLEDDREEQVRELQMLYTLTQLTTKDAALQEIYEYAVTFLMRGMRCQKSSILLFDESGVMQFRAASGLSAEYMAAATGHSPWTADAVNPQPIFINDVNDEPSLEHLRPHILREGIRALGFIPLLHDGRLLGKFMVYYDTPCTFTERDAQLALTIAQTIANAIARKRNALALTAGEEKLRTIFSAMEEGIALNELVYDDQGAIIDYRILEVNPAFERIAGLSHEQVVGRLATDIYRMSTEYIRGFWKEHLQDTEAIKTDLYTEMTGSWKHVSTSIPVNGIFVTSFIDITDLKTNELALQTSEQYNRTLLDSSPNAMAVTDLNGIVVYVNNRALEMYGYEPGDTVADAAILQWVPDTHHAEAALRIESLLAGRNIEHFVLPLLRKDGSTFIGEVNATAVRGPDGRPVNFLVITADMTSRIKAEEEVRKTNAQLLSLFNSQTSFVIRTDISGRYTFANERFCRAFGYDRSTLIGSSATGTYLAEDHPAVEQAVHRCVEHPGTAVGVTLRKMHPTLGILVSEWEFLAITDESGRPTEIQCVGHDITEKHHAQEALRQSEQRHRNIVENLYQSYYESDRYAMFTYVNPGLLMMSGYTEAELMTRSAFRIVAEADRTAVVDAYKRWMTERKRRMSIEFRVRTKAGVVFWVEQTSHFEFDEQGRFVRATNFVRDIEERKRSEMQLFESELRYRKITEAVTDYIYTVIMENGAAVATKHGPGCFAVTGYSVEEFEQHRFLWSTMIVPEDRSMVEDHIHHTLERRSSNPVEHRIIRKDGTLRWVRNTLVPRYSDDGVLLSYEGLIQDITERRTAEEELRHSEERNRALVRTIPDMMFVQDVDGRFLDMHVPEQTRTLIPIEYFVGRTMEELLSQFHTFSVPWFELMAPELPVAVSVPEAILEFVVGVIRQKIRAASESGSIQTYEYSVRTESGISYYEARLIGFDHNRILHIIRDITEARVADENLRKSERRNRALIEALPDLLFVMDGNGRFVDYHAPLDLALYTSPDLFIGKYVTEILPADISALVLPRIKRALQTNTLQHYEYSLAMGAETRFYEARLVAFGDDLVVNIVRDVTARITAEFALKALNEELEDRVKQRTLQLTEANQELEAFSYSVSHDLRAPLRAIDSFTAMLVEGYGEKFDAEGRRLIGVVRTSIRRMDQLINGLLTLSRIGKNDLQLTTVEMNGFVAEILREHLPDEERARYIVDIGPLPPCTADLTLLRQAMGNLFSNAVKYSSAMPHPEIRVSGIENEDGITYSVRDNGVGFDPANTGKLFGIFQRLHTNEQFKGLGIGLSIVQRIIHRHGGRVKAEGQVNGGALFSFTLPHRTPPSDG